MATAPEVWQEWRKSSHSGGGNNDCVEVAFRGDHVGVRDSKNIDGARLAFTPEDWRAFVQRRDWRS